MSSAKRIAAELNLSETAFVEIQKKGQLRIHWFTPKVEVKLCGHATLAAAHILFQEKLVPGNQLEFQFLSGPLRVKNNKNTLTLDFPLQITGPILKCEPFQKIFGSSLISVVQAYDDIIIELCDEDAGRNLNIAPNVWSQFDYRGFIITAKGRGAYDFISRFFAPRVGIDEDPVTGSAHCKLVHYWSEKLGKSKFLAYQASKRGEVLEIEIIGDRVFLSGKAFTVIKGSLEID